MVATPPRKRPSAKKPTTPPETLSETLSETPADRSQREADRSERQADRSEHSADRSQRQGDAAAIAAVSLAEKTVSKAESLAEAHSEQRHADRLDVEALTREVAGLREGVAELNDLIMASLVKAEQASARAERSPDKGRVYGLIAGSVVLALVLAFAGIYTTQKISSQAADVREVQYQICLTRNTTQLGVIANQEYLAILLQNINAAVQKAKTQGDPLATDLGSLLDPAAQPPVTSPVLIDCSLLK